MSLRWRNSSVLCADEVAFYEMFVPEEERHESAMKRKKESLIAELKLWESYLEKVFVIISSFDMLYLFR